MSTYQTGVDYYSVLGVSRDASTKEINFAFKRLALKLHPDKSGGDRASVEQFHLTQEAVETLRDPERRRRHDKSLSRHSFNINHKSNGQPCFNRACGSPNKYDKSEENNGGDRNPFKPHHTSRASPNEHSMSYSSNGSDRNPLKPQHTSSRTSPNEHSSSECGRKGEPPPPRQRYKSTLNMWGPFIHAYNARPPRPILKASMSTHPPKPTDEAKDDSQTQPVTVAPETQKAPAEPQPNKTQTPTMQDKQAEETVKKDVADGPDTPSDEPLDSNGNSIFHDSTDYESLGDSCPDDHLSSHLHSWVASGYDSSSEGAAVSLAGESGDDQEREDDTMNTMYYDCSEHLEHGSNEESPISTDNKSTGHKTEENTDDKTDESTDKIYKTWIDKIEKGQEELDSLAKSLRPFIPYFDGKLLSSEGRYTTDDMLGEMRGLFLEPYRGWLDAARLTIPGAMESRNSSNPELCEHMGLWAKTYGCSECRFCKLYKPMYVLTCPTCGKQACIRCKFNSPSTGAETNEAGGEEAC